MNSLLKLKKIPFSNFWVRSELIIVGNAILVNHLTEEKHFPFNEGYEFPWLPIIVSILVTSLMLYMACKNFRYYKANYFTTKVTAPLLLRFLFTTLGYIAIAYTFIYFIIVGLVNGPSGYSLYHGITDLFVSLLLCAIGIPVVFGKEIYRLYKSTATSGVVKVQQGGKITPVNRTEIAYLYSAQKVVYLVKTDSSEIVTDFTLNDIETEMSELGFYRANRQTILHARSIKQVTAIENGKLTVQLKPIISREEQSQITISRYKKQAFKDWLESNL